MFKKIFILIISSLFFFSCSNLRFTNWGIEWGEGLDHDQAVQAGLIQPYQDYQDYLGLLILYSAITGKSLDSITPSYLSWYRYSYYPGSPYWSLYSDACLYRSILESDIGQYHFELEHERLMFQLKMNAIIEELKREIDRAKERR